MGVIKLAFYDLVRTLKNPKTWVIFLLCIFFFANQVLDMRGLAEYFQIGITPYVYPLFMTFGDGRMYALILVVMMMGEAPYYNGAEVFISMRISRYRWFVSKLVYIFLLSVITQLVMMAVSVLVCAPYIGMSSDWGDIIVTYMNSMQGAISASGTIDNGSILSLSPVTCMVYEFVLMLFISIIIALMIFVLNGVFKNIIGTILVGIAVMVDIYLTDLAIFSIIDMEYILPTTWVDINVFFVGRGLSFEKCTLYMMLIIVILTLICLALVGKKVIRPVKNV